MLYRLKAKKRCIRSDLTSVNQDDVQHPHTRRMARRIRCTCAFAILVANSAVGSRSNTLQGTRVDVLLVASYKLNLSKERVWEGTTTVLKLYNGQLTLEVYHPHKKRARAEKGHGRACPTRYVGANPGGSITYLMTRLSTFIRSSSLVSALRHGTGWLCVWNTSVYKYTYSHTYRCVDILCMRITIVLHTYICTPV